MAPSGSTTQRLQVADGRHGVPQFIYLQLKKVYHFSVINSFPRHTGKQNKKIRCERDSEIRKNGVGEKTVHFHVFRNIWANTEKEQLVLWGMSYY